MFDAEDVRAVAGVEIETEGSVGRLHQVRGVDELRHPASVAGGRDKSAGELEMHAVLGAQKVYRGLRTLPHAVDAVPYARITVRKAVHFEAPGAKIEKGLFGVGTEDGRVRFFIIRVGPRASREADERRLAEPAVGDECEPRRII